MKLLKTLVLGLTMVATQANAQGVSRILSGYPPGGAIDILARVFAEELTKGTGKTYIVETKSGAGGQLAVETLKSATPDGNTLLMAAETNMVVYPHTVRKPTYTVRDFTPVAIAASYDIGFASRMDPKVTDFSSWLSLARRDPDAATYASPGAGSNMHFFGILLGDAAGVKLRHVPYRGTGPAINDVAGGFVSTVLSPVGTMLQHANTKLRIIATSGTKRSAKAPNTPTFAELGYPQLTQTGWFGLFAPAGTPPEQIANLHAIVAASLKRPEVQARIAALDMQIMPISQQEFAAQVTQEYAKWESVIKATGFTAEGQ
jgi:tripartite-type tricarboxylate transporter receptor subunit TctC